MLYIRGERGRDSMSSMQGRKVSSRIPHCPISLAVHWLTPMYHSVSTVYPRVTFCFPTKQQLSASYTLDAIGLPSGLLALQYNDICIKWAMRFARSGGIRSASSRSAHANYIYRNIFLRNDFHRKIMILWSESVIFFCTVFVWASILDSLVASSFVLLCKESDFIPIFR